MDATLIVIDSDADRPKTEIAKLLGVSRQTLYDILEEKQPVTPVMALRMRRSSSKICASRRAIVSKLCTGIAADNMASALTINGGYALSGEKARRGTSRSWIATEDDAMSIKREDLDAGRIDLRQAWRRRSHRSSPATSEVFKGRLCRHEENTQHFVPSIHSSRSF